MTDSLWHLKTTIFPISKYCVTTCHKQSVPLQYETSKTKNEKTMGTAYKIRCRHCGTQFDHYIGNNYGILPACVGCGEYVETEMPIRCPACRHKLNATQEEFNEQVEITYIWD